jgi:hypothetical protein
MATAVTVQNEVSPSRLGEVVRAVSRLGFDLVVSCLGRLCGSFPLSLAGCTALCLVLTAGTALLLRNGAGPVAWICLAVLIACHLTAAAVWAVQRTLDGGAKAGLAVLDSHLPEICNLLLAPLVEAGQERVPRLSVAQVRGYFQQAGQALVVAPDDRRWWAVIHRVASVVVRWVLRAELALVESALGAFERRGETHLTLDALKNIVRDEALARGRTLAMANLWQWELAAAAVVLVLLAGPAVVVWAVV